MELICNGRPTHVADGTSVATLLDTIAADTRGVAVAVDGTVVRRGDWAARVLHDGARVEIVGASQGG